MTSNEYYFNINFSDSDETVTMDANLDGWQSFLNALQNITNELSEKNNIISKFFSSDLLTLYSSGKDYISIENLQIILDTNLVDYSKEINLYLSLKSFFTTKLKPLNTTILNPSSSPFLRYIL